MQRLMSGQSLEIVALDAELWRGHLICHPRLRELEERALIGLKELLIAMKKGHEFERDIRCGTIGRLERHSAEWI